MAAMTAKWNVCPFCVGAHGAIAAHVLGKPLVKKVLDDVDQAELPTKLRATLTFLEILTRRPDTLTAEEAQVALREGVRPKALEDAIAASVLFNITARCADALGYAMLEENEFDRAAKRLLVQGYAFGKGKTPIHPNHRALAEAMRRRTLEGVTDAALRQAVAERAGGGRPVQVPYDDLARQIGEAAYELIVASALGAGIHRWQVGLKVLEAAIQ